MLFWKKTHEFNCISWSDDLDTDLIIFPLQIFHLQREHQHLNHFRVAQSVFHNAGDPLHWWHLSLIRFRCPLSLYNRFADSLTCIQKLHVACNILCGAPALLGPPLEHFYPSLQHQNSPANSVRELFKSSEDSSCLLVSIKKNYFIWFRGSFVGTS